MSQILVVEEYEPEEAFPAVEQVPKQRYSQTPSAIRKRRQRAVEAIEEITAQMEDGSKDERYLSQHVELDPSLGAPAITGYEELGSHQHISRRDMQDIVKNGRWGEKRRTKSGEFVDYSSGKIDEIAGRLLHGKNSYKFERKVARRNTEQLVRELVQEVIKNTDLNFARLQGTPERKRLIEDLRKATSTYQAELGKNLRRTEKRHNARLTKLRIAGAID